MANDVPLLTAFVAGMVSFASPCCLPLVPLYLAHLAGIAVSDVGHRAHLRVATNAAAFVLGFGLVFVVLGVALGAAGTLVSMSEIVAGNRIWLVRIGGALLILLGLHQLNLISIPGLAQERRWQVDGTSEAGRLTSSFLVGVTFGAGWSPCVGPILGVILTMAMTEADIGRSTLLLTAYAAGLAIVFFIAGAAFGAAPGLFRRLNSRLHTITTISGALMVAAGAVMLLGIYQDVFADLAGLGTWSPWEPEL